MKRQISRGLGLMVLLALVVPFVIYAIPGVVGAEYSFVVLTGSMSPAIEAGDVVIVDEADPGTVETGDVITFVRGSSETPVTHRVVDVEGDGNDRNFETKGDANEDVDANPVPPENVLGTVLITIPYIGYVIQAANSQTGFILLVAVPIGLLVTTELWSLLVASHRSPGATAKAAEATVDEPGMKSDGTETKAPSAAEANDDDAERTIDTDATANSADGAVSGGVVLTENDLQLSTGVLVGIVPYCIYVAWELQTTLTITVAFAATLSAIAIGGTLVSLRWSGGDGDDMDPESSSDGSDGMEETTGADEADEPDEAPGTDAPNATVGSAGTVESGTGGADGAGGVTDGGEPADSGRNPESVASSDGSAPSTEAENEDRVEIPVVNGADPGESTIGGDSRSDGRIAGEAVAGKSAGDDVSRGTTARNGEDQK